ncbi:MAG TPA: pyruvate:ferredoxin (flavodoxin) oxidoreductase [Phycisphaerae bacterium]|nr:pyruvate:ferredoxin (flavodoxin) oxidoreductase [Phycisphaerae bacterium]
MITIDGNEAAARVAYRASEVIAIYPITPSSGMGELSDAWAAQGMKNLWGTTPRVVEMQSEGGAAGALHGSVQIGALTTTFTASQGLLLMIPNMFKIAGELTPAVFHVSARSIAAHALSIFGDHSDVMATRSTGWALLASGSVQEVTDMAAIAHAATLESRIPFIHFFDGFRTSHEVSKIEALTDDQLRQLINNQSVLDHRARGLSPDHPVLRGSAQNPDVFFQAREACNSFYATCPQTVQQVMDRFAEITGRSYHLFDYVGDPKAERVIVMMGSGAEAAHETVNHLVAQGEKIGLLKVRLYRPLDGEALIKALPKSAVKVAVLDRTKEPGALGEPLYQDVVTAMSEHFDAGRNGFAKRPMVVGGRYGLSSKEFSPAMVKGIYDELTKDQPKNHFTVGIVDDVTHTSIDYDTDFSTEPKDVVRAVFYGLGSDGTVGANKNSIKIIGEETDNFAQGYFVYDSKKAGSVTTSHLRFGPRPIQSSYLISRANFAAVHHEQFLKKYDILDIVEPGATLLLNIGAEPDEVWDRLPKEVQQSIIDKKLKLYAIDAYAVGRKIGLGGRINTLMQSCFFAISGVLPRDEAITHIKTAIMKSYGGKGDKVVKMNFLAVDSALENLHEIPVPDRVSSSVERPAVVSDRAPTFVKSLTAKIIANEGDRLPVSAMPVDGTFPTATAKWEKRSIANEIPIWDADVCIQCGKCAMVCPHASIRMKAYSEECLAGAPAQFKSAAGKGKEYKDLKFTIQVAPQDCTGCGICVDICPAKNKEQPKFKAINMKPLEEHLEPERDSFDFFLDIPEFDRTALKIDSVKGSQFLEPLFEYSGACAGCGETPYVKLMSQLFGDRSVIANATGCSSIYGGNLPTTPWTTNRDGRGPAWSNSLFEDNAEFGLGFRVAIDKQKEFAAELLQHLSGQIGGDLVEAILSADQSNEAGIIAQRERVAKVKVALDSDESVAAKNLLSVIDTLVKRSVWIVGGDGWAYDIGFGGLDHVLASGANVNVLVLDTEVYSNTGGQCSKATPRGAVAKFAAAGKPSGKKDLGLMAMSYGNVYVAKVAMGANDNQCVKAFIEAESYDGPSLIIAYSHCIAHGINMTTAMNNQQAAVKSGYWPLFRYDPRRVAESQRPLQLDSPAARMPLGEFTRLENRFAVLERTDADRATSLRREQQQQIAEQRAFYEEIAGVSKPKPEAPAEPSTDNKETASAN